MSDGVRRAHRLASTTVLMLILGCLTMVATARPSAAADPCGSAGNAIACENSKPGSPESAWEIDKAGDDDIQGFSTDISVNVGSTVDFKIDTDASAYSITIFRMGWYGGDGARQVATVTPSAQLPQVQPACITDVTTELTDCGNWGVSASWKVPSDAVSGVYIAHLRRNDNGDDSNITFIVRNDASHSDIVFQTSDPTWEAYNTYGGADFYKGGANGRAYAVSYNRPVTTRADESGGQDFLMANEYPAIRFLERNGYDVSYLAGVDTDRYGSLIKNHKVFLSVGHDEYWSGGQRANVEAARDAGVSLQFLSGNEVYWRTRYEPSADASHTPYRTLVSYKEAWSKAKIDPTDQSTSTWRDPRYSPKSKGGGLPENALTGTIFMSNYTDLPITVTKAEGKLRLWRNTGLSSMTGASTPLAPHTVGYESDEDQDNGFRPPGLIDLSTTIGDIDGQYMHDYGLVTGDGTTTHSLTLYRASSGALVFGAGTVQWSWGLDDEHDTPYPYEPADPRMQQAEANLLADMGAQPTTLMSGLVTPTKSTDTTGPTVAIASPAAGAAVGNGDQVTVSGTATDTGGGLVAGVEYSTDGGTSWHPATGTTSWSFTYTQHGVGSTPLQVRAVDDSANIGESVSRSFAVSCPCSIFGTATPSTTYTSTVPAAMIDTGETTPVELGTRFTADADGFVSGIRFYKAAANVGTHVGTLWSSSGQKLASATFTGESDSGWQSVTFSPAVAVSAGATYIASYTAPNGHYTAQNYAFGESGLDAYPFTLAGGFGSTPAAVYGLPGKYPVSSYESSNYFVDVQFTTTDASPLTAINHWPVDGVSSVPASTSVSATFTKPVVASSVGVTLKDSNGAAVSGSTSYDSVSRTVTFTPAAALAGYVTYTATLSATDQSGVDLTSGKSWSFRTAAPPGQVGVCPCSLFDENTVPTVLDATDGSPVTLGVRFSATQSGTVTGVRFYKAATNTGTHTGQLWTTSGTLLASGTFTDESTAGWQTLTFPTPVRITSGTEYVASYFSPSGHWSVTPNGFAAADLSRGPIHVASNSGQYQYPDAFPVNRSANNYLVDVVFQKADPTLSVLAESPPDGAVAIPRATPISITLSAPITSASSVVVSKGTSGTALAGTTALDASGTTLTFTPASMLPADSDIGVQVSGLASVDGATLPTQTWTFHTRGLDALNAQSMFSDQVPRTAAAADNASVEVGTAFKPDANGTISAIRFFKGTGNGGTHTGHLWTSAGRLLATVTFTGETASGWQQATVSPAVAVTAGTTYVVSYLAPQGHYAVSAGFFNTAFTMGDLTAPGSNNGLYLYGSGGFPKYTYNASNYWVDVVFAPDPPAITQRAPDAGVRDVSTAAKPSVSFSADLADGYSMVLTAGNTQLPGSVALSADRRTLTFTPDAPLPNDTDVSVQLKNIASTQGASLADSSWTFHTVAPTTTSVSLFAGLTPQTVTASDGKTIELGTAIKPGVDGQITAIRFYKGAGNTGTHTGSIWSSDGTLLTSVTFTGETASGWQQATLSKPLSVSAGQTYVVSYYSPTGKFSLTPNFFTGPKSSGSLTALAANGRYAYSSGGVFPGTTSGNGSNYLVDVVFQYGS